MYSTFLWPEGQRNSRADTFLVKVQRLFALFPKSGKGEELQAIGHRIRWWNSSALALPLTTLASLHAASPATFHTLLPAALHALLQRGMMKACPCVKLLVVTSTHKIKVTYHNDTLSSRALSQDCKALQKRYKLSVSSYQWWNWDKAVATGKGQPLLEAATNYRVLFVTTVLPIIFEKLCQILLPLVVCSHRR